MRALLRIHASGRDNQLLGVLTYRLTAILIAVVLTPSVAFARDQLATVVNDEAERRAAVAALQLVQAGKYLPNYANKGVAAVTIEQLLMHPGGTDNIFAPEYFERRLETREHQDYLELFGTRDVAFPPGSRWDFSNYGMILLGRVIEVVSGQCYYDYTRMQILEPLSMNNTGNDPEVSRVADLSTGYTHMGLRPGPPGIC